MASNKTDALAWAKGLIDEGIDEYILSELPKDLYNRPLHRTALSQGYVVPTGYGLLRKHGTLLKGASTYSKQYRVVKDIRKMTNPNCKLHGTGKRWSDM